ncbi:fumarate reductase/succinate dehydrogenase flavoprotein subunit [Kitasatospora paracochleata]|uniref:Succinate dehydrogenase/fumarate reductase flavoprotein subunit/HEAT repeat protein n=1 Tax=Kitasatospora paracochleata TaxID=58354 RepID=A0ABT1IXT8_9ACTN|nr:fumarate reductase/succinate dehydrogenase flavoprotein subunit [Kitasatospora paracochleata]MCP2309691.1 succinate dehydrogenase/fumarate reductase flavoprotein subunit/HEAT repeat protein [Kitasatospora paracochleata]
MRIPDLAEARRLSCDVLVVGGGTAGSMAAISAAEAGASVLLLEKAHVRHSGALAMGMDGVNNAVVPGRADPDAYVAEITRANDGIVDQRTVRQTATRGFAMVQRLERYGVKFEKDEHGAYQVRQVHRSGSYVLPMPEGKDVKKVLYRVLRRREMRERITIENRVMPVRVLTSGGRAVGAAGFDTRSGEFVTVSAGAVVLATGPCGRLGLPASGYLYGTYENPTNAGDGYAMAYHAGAELSGIECFQVNPLIKDYNGPACAYVANPFGGYQVNRHGARFVDSDYWSGQMMAEFAAELASDRGPVYLRTTHLPEETVRALESILHTTERPSRGTFHAGRGHDYRTHDVEMHISEIGLCGGHSASGVWVDENAATTVPGLYAAGDLACVPHNYMIGAFVFGDLAGTHAAAHLPERPTDLPEDQLRAAHDLVYRPLRHPDGPPQPQVEYKLRRFVNDYVAPPKTGARLSVALEHFERMRGEIAGLGARTPHELMRAVEVDFIRDCAEMAARASLAREESRWGLYHERIDHPGRDDRRWFRHLNLRKGAGGAMEFLTRPVAPYLVPVDGLEPPGGEIELLGEVHPMTVGRTGVTTEAAAPAATAVASAASPRLLELLRLTEATPAQLAPYLRDPAAEVRRTALALLTETAHPGTGAALADALADPDTEVRAAAVAALRELVEVLDGTLGPALAAAADSPDPVVRAGALELSRALRTGTVGLYAAGLADPDVPVRLHAVHGLVALDAAAVLAPAAADAAREVRVAVGEGLGTIADPAAAPALLRLATDPDPLVRAAAFTGAAGLGSPGPLAALAARPDPAWQVRRSAATALGVAGDLPPLLALLTDDHMDVRKSAVRALTPHAGTPDVSAALRDRLADPDADVRAYARLALKQAR